MNTDKSTDKGTAISMGRKSTSKGTATNASPKPNVDLISVAIKLMASTPMVVSFIRVTKIESKSFNCAYDNTKSECTINFQDTNHQ
jgi:hypothetical protein